jgi:hypothetical protein
MVFRVGQGSKTNSWRGEKTWMAGDFVRLMGMQFGATFTL